MLEVYNLLNKLEFLEEVAILEYEEWADNKEKDRENRIVKKIEKIKMWHQYNYLNSIQPP